MIKTSNLKFYVAIAAGLAIGYSLTSKSQGDKNPADAILRMRVKYLESSLKKAVEKEEYEIAAQCRDELKNLQTIL